VGLVVDRRLLGRLRHFWALAARKARETKQAESIGSRLSHAVPMFIGGALLAAPVDLGPWSTATERGPVRVAVAVLLTTVGVGFAVWARTVLGRNWSGRVTLKHDHELIRSGPYALVRHPIYTGILVAVLGSAILIGGWRAVAGFAIFMFAISIKIRLEERVMSQAFADAYRDYSRETWRLLPGVW
jgi:protein-S-isoprenylcysteine O-methyltransferase Ste14